MTNGGNKLLQLYWMKIWHVNSSVKIHSLSPNHVWKLSSFLYWQLNWRTWPQSNRKTPQSANLMRLSYQMFFECLRNCAQAVTKIPRIEAKIYQKTDFLSSEGHFLTSAGCCLTLASSLDVVQVRFASWSVYRVLLRNDLSNLSAV